MADLNKLSARYQHKKLLENRLEALLEEVKDAEQAVRQGQARCEEENLDLRKFESNDFKQFWLKLRGQYEQRLLENNEKAALAMKNLNEAKTHVFDLEKEIAQVRDTLRDLSDAEEAYETALAQRIEHLDYSVHREEIIRMRERISYDEYQKKCLEDVIESVKIAQRLLEDLRLGFRQMDLDGDGLLDVTDESQIKFITGCSELRVRIHIIEQLLSEIDAHELEELHISEKFTINTLDLFFNKGTKGLQKIASKKATQSLRATSDALDACDITSRELLREMALRKTKHQEALEQFIAETEI